MKREASGFDVNGLDEIVHGRLRLGILAYLAGAGEADFNALAAHLGATNGNLSIHLSKLENADYVTLERMISGKRTRTIVHLTEAGRHALRAYVEHMAQLVGQLV
jgi:DNA-binding MarR family transcriptional regulator